MTQVKPIHSLTGLIFCSAGSHATLFIEKNSWGRGLDADYLSMRQCNRLNNYAILPRYNKDHRIVKCLLENREKGCNSRLCNSCIINIVFLIQSLAVGKSFIL